MVFAGSSGLDWSEEALPLNRASVRRGNFFPPSVIKVAKDQPARSSFPNFYRQAWALADADEPALPTLAKAAPRDALLLRFIWLPSFDSPVVVRVILTADGQQRLVAKQTLSLRDWSDGTAR